VYRATELNHPKHPKEPKAMQVDTLLITRKLDEATSKMAPDGERPPLFDTIPVEFTYSELMMIWNCIALRDAIRTAVEKD